MNCFVPVSDRDRGKTGRASCRIGVPTVVSQPRLVKIDVQMDRCFCLMILVLLRYQKNIRKNKLALIIVRCCSSAVRGYLRVSRVFNKERGIDKSSACHLGALSRYQTSAAPLSISTRAWYGYFQNAWTQDLGCVVIVSVSPPPERLSREHPVPASAECGQYRAAG